MEIKYKLAINEWLKYYYKMFPILLLHKLSRSLTWHVRLIVNWLLITFYFSNSRSSIISESDTVEFIDVATGSISATNYIDFIQSKYNYKLPFQNVKDIAISVTNLYRYKNCPPLRHLESRNPVTGKGVGRGSSSWRGMAMGWP